MNLALFLTPLSQVMSLSDRVSLRRAIEEMQTHGFTAVPVVDDEGRFVGTLTEGDLLRKLVDDHLGYPDAERVRLAEVPRRTRHAPVEVTAEIGDVLSLAADQNYVPVVDSRGVLMGIVTRKTILEWLAGELRRAGQGG